MERLEEPRRLLYRGALGVLTVLAVWPDMVWAQTYTSRLSCLSSNTVTVTSVTIKCGCPETPPGGGTCPNDCDPVAFPGVTFVATNFQCTGVLDPDDDAPPIVIPPCPPPRCTNPAPPCVRRAEVAYNCNGGPPKTKCLAVPTPGSGQATSVDLNCSPGPDAVFALEEVPTGACCLPNNGCTLAVTQDACIKLGGRYEGSSFVPGVKSPCSRAAGANSDRASVICGCPLAFTSSPIVRSVCAMERHSRCPRCDAS